MSVLVEMAVPCLNSKDDLPVSKVLELLLNSNAEGTVSVLPPVKPRSGEVYLFSAAGNTKAKGECQIILIFFYNCCYCKHR